MNGFNLSSGTFKPGDQVQQIADFALAQLQILPFVVKVDKEGLELSKSPNGPPIVGLDEQVRHYPPRIFRKVTW